MSDILIYFFAAMKKPFLFLLLIIFSLGCTPDKPESVTPASDILLPGSPEVVGMSSERLDRIDAMIEEYIDNGWIPGAVTLIARHGKIVHYKGYGMRDMEAGDPLEKDDIFRIASMTKAITCMAVMILYEEGKFQLDDPVSNYIPEYKNPEVLVSVNPDSTYTSRPAKSEITIRQLLTHTSGLGYPIFNPEISAVYYKAGIIDAWSLDADLLSEKMKVLGKLPILFDPGEQYLYGLSIDVLGYLVEVLSGKSLREFLSERLFDPLGMEDTDFYLPGDKADRLINLYSETKSGLILSESELYADFPLRSAKTYYSGGGGLCATTLDYARFMQMMLNGGHYNGNQILSPKTIELITTNQIGDFWDVNGMGLGFGIIDKKGADRALISEGSYRWGGYFHTHYWIDPQEDLIALLMLQILPHQHPEIEDKFQVLTYQAITKLN
ncbi:serine hydrolase domain-containing protein [Bacteroidota bacterium]